MCFGHSPLEMALSLLEDGISEEALPLALAAQVHHLDALADADLPFSVAD